MLEPNTPLAKVFADFLDDQSDELAPSTHQPYRSHLRVAREWLAEELLTKEAASTEETVRQKVRQPVLTDLVPENFRKLIKTLKKGHVYSARGKAIALRAVGTYLAKGGYWYLGTKDQRISVMERLEIPTMPAKGRPVYGDDDLRTIRRAAAAHRTRPYFHAAMQFIHELGLRAGFEAMTVLLEDVHFSRGRYDQGYIEIREENTKTQAGVRQVPLEPEAEDALQRYVRMERPSYTGADPHKQALLLTLDGRNYSYSGWNSMLQRFKRAVREIDPELTYQASRNRGTRTLKLRESRDYSDTEIMQLMGWSSPKMMARYSGAVPRSAFRGRAATTRLDRVRRSA